MKSLFALFVCFLFCASYGQNLVPNPSFEELKDCPSSGLAFPNIVSWYNPNTGSPDIFNACMGASCEDDPYFCVPENFTGYQMPRTGSGYAGIYVGLGEKYREYLGVRLLSPLVAGETYILRYYVSLPEKKRYSLDRLGVLLSTDSVTGDEFLNYTPRSISPPGRFLDDIENWMLIADTLVASGGEEYLTMGNFYTDQATNTRPQGEGTAYYYIDDVKLVHEDFNLTIQGERSICVGESTTLTALYGTTYSWTDSTNKWVVLSTDSAITVSPDKTTTYVVSGNDCSNSVTVEVIHPPTLDLGNDTSLCEGEVLELYAVDSLSPELSYLWSDNTTNAQIRIRETDDYWVALSNSCWTVVDTMYAEFENCNCPVFFPTAFSPNDDGLNDQFSAFFDCEIETFELMIFNRWGQQVFRASDPFSSWDGTFGGKRVPIGFYVYQLWYKSRRKLLNTISGGVTVIR